MIIKERRDILENKGAWILAEAIQQAAVAKSRVVVAVPGGRSVASLLKNLKQESVDWEKVHLFMVDERLVPRNHKDSNFRLVRSCLKEISDSIHMHPFPYIKGDTERSVCEYEEQLLELGGRFDITLLASGEDGHVAGLFPEHETVRSDEDYFVLTGNAPKSPSERVSSTRKLIAKSGMVLLLFFGREKQGAFKMYLDRDIPFEQCPAKVVDSVTNRYVLTDYID